MRHHKYSKHIYCLCITYGNWHDANRFINLFVNKRAQNTTQGRPSMKGQGNTILDNTFYLFIFLCIKYISILPLLTKLTAFMIQLIIYIPFIFKNQHVLAFADLCEELICQSMHDFIKPK